MAVARRLSALAMTVELSASCGRPAIVAVVAWALAQLPPRPQLGARAGRREARSVAAEVAGATAGASGDAPAVGALLAADGATAFG